MVINKYPNFFQLPIEELMSKLEDVVTQKCNPTVHRMTFSGVSQSDSESIQSFIVQLKSASTNCAFTCPKCHYDLSDIYILDQLIRGLSNEILQTDILTKADTLPTLETVARHSEAFEGALRDQGKLHENAEVQAMKSTYQRQKQKPPSNGGWSQNKKPSGAARTDRQPPTRCQGCGSD